ncbi:MAG: hypothetical protein HEEMFOPI_00764 [Holosporales bacterium]
MTKELLTVNAVSKLINDGRILLLAGDEALLSQLPSGKWIGGTSANFMTSDGGKTVQDQIFVTDITEYSQSINIKTYSLEELKDFPNHYPDNGFSVIIIPGLSDIHKKFAEEVSEYDNLFNTPLVGWVSGVHVIDIDKISPKVFAGSNTPIKDEAVVMYVTLPDDVTARVNIINLFDQATEGPTIEFKGTGFVVEEECLIDGQPYNLARYFTENEIDTRYPLVANYSGAKINVCSRFIDADIGKVQFYAPVFTGIKYKLAISSGDYVKEFEQQLSKKDDTNVVFSCNCILNYVYADLEGQKTGHFVGPITFGEIAYILLNQTLVYLDIVKKDDK